jgi:hypothetical protein
MTPTMITSIGVLKPRGKDDRPEDVIHRAYRYHAGGAQWPSLPCNFDQLTLSGQMPGSLGRPAFNALH